MANADNKKQRTRMERGKKEGQSLRDVFCMKEKKRGEKKNPDKNKQEKKREKRDKQRNCPIITFALVQKD